MKPAFVNWDRSHAFSTKLVLALIGLATSAAFAQAQEEKYKLGIPDRIRVHVYDWPQLTGEFTLDADGKISLPLLGELTVEGLELPQLGRIISERLKLKAGTLDVPDTSVSVIEYRPFYILGWVQRPGEYPYRPGMMTLSAISVAGGFYRPPVESGWVVFRDAMTGYGDVKVLDLKRAELSAREMRLRAELEEADFGSQASNDARTFIEHEVALFDARRIKRDEEIGALNRRNSLYLQELATLNGQRQAVAKDRALVDGELKRIRGLVERGLTTAAQSVVLERSIAQIEREALDVDTQALRARQQISIGEQTIGTLRNEYKTEAATELATVQTELREIGPRREAALRIVSESGSMIESEAGNEDADPLHGIDFEITRKDQDGVPRQIEASRTTILQPGDILNVVKRGSDRAPTPGTVSTSVNTASSGNGQLR